MGGGEKSLSVDNLFIFSITFTRFAVPAEYRHKILLYGIAFAVCLRAVFIALGAAAISLFSFTFLLFGLVLLWTAVQLIRHRDEEPDVEDTWLVRRARSIMPVAAGYHGGRMLAVEDGRRVMTPVLLVFVAIGSADLLFALDSIPAVFGVSSEPFIVFAANAFALFGLRALFFLIEGLLERLVYLAIGLSLILALIGVKLILLFLHEDVTETVPKIPTSLSLALILFILIVTAIASVLRVRTHPEERAHPGAVRVRRSRPTTAPRRPRTIPGTDRHPAEPTPLPREPRAAQSAVLSLPSSAGVEADEFAAQRAPMSSEARGGAMRAHSPAPATLAHDESGEGFGHVTTAGVGTRSGGVGCSVVARTSRYGPVVPGTALD
ncbi:MAG: TerC/Alx family metal homeostasis membrane protein [Actinoallomurus sp.]